ncbi:unnamed protein product [Schistosoma curassoni]|uniref:Uncharacterized protein n=1 Tax=Schistosoma curassoni TaxID=6186 RepID=A0A183KM36_9TREM|nr:unnamed protein product [Schistosoma curassoni]
MDNNPTPMNPTDNGSAPTIIRIPVNPPTMGDIMQINCENATGPEIVSAEAPKPHMKLTAACSNYGTLFEITE